MATGAARVFPSQRQTAATRKKTDLICFSHLRWDFVYQRPQHLLSRFGKATRVFFMEEPLFDSDIARVELTRRQDNLWVAAPHVPPGAEPPRVNAFLQEVVQGLLATQQIEDYVLWYYTPMAIEYTRGLSPRAVIYDCMDELSAFHGAPPALRENEVKLMAYADVVFTGGRSLFESKRTLHRNVHAFPSSIDVAHFSQARTITQQPADQASIPAPRLGFAGVIDERSDLALIDNLARSRPDWQLVMIGPVVKVDPASLPRHPNIHYLGPKSYNDLPSYFSGWDVALIPFALNDATRFISPTKTPEYLAAGLRVVSTPIRDVVHPYGDAGLVEIATADDFIAAVERALAKAREDDSEWREAVDRQLATSSWDATWSQMSSLIDSAVNANIQKESAPVGTSASPVANYRIG